MAGKRFFHVLLGVSFLVAGSLPARGKELLIPAGSLSETTAPMWVGVEKGFFKKYGLDVKMLQVRSGGLSMAALASGSVQIVQSSPASIIGFASAGGVKVVCFASTIDKIPRNLMVRKEIQTLADLREKTFGIQSIGGGFWLQTMLVLDALGVDPDQYKLRLRVIGDTGTITQALIAGNLDAAVLPYSFSESAKRAGFRALADAANLRIAYQGSGLCAERNFVAANPEVILQLVKGLSEAVAFIEEGKNKQDVTLILKRMLRFDKPEAAEASYGLLRLMTNLNLGPNLAAWKLMQKIVAHINPKVNQLDVAQLVDGSFVRKLEEDGFLPELRKKQK